MKAYFFCDNLDTVSNTPIMVRARISVIPKEEDGRIGPFTKGYRPNHNFGGPENKMFFVGEIVIGENEWVYPGETREVLVKFLDVRGLREMLVFGREWRIQEGGKVVANATVLSNAGNENLCAAK